MNEKSFYQLILKAKIAILEISKINKTYNT